MDFLERNNLFLHQQRINNSLVFDYNAPETKMTSLVSDMKSRMLEMEEAEQARRTAQNQRAERMCAAQTIHEHTVMRRLGLCIQQDTFPSPQPPASPSTSRNSAERPARIRRNLYVAPLHVEEGRKYSGHTSKYSTKLELDEEDPFFDLKLQLGNKMESLANTLARFRDKDGKLSPKPSTGSVDIHSPRKPSPKPSISSEDIHSPRKPSPKPSISSEDIHSPRKPRPDHIPFTPCPPSPTLPRRKRSRLPVKSFAAGPSKKVAGCTLQSPSAKVCKVLEKVEQVKQVKQVKPLQHPSSRVPAPPRKMAPVPKPPGEPAQSKKRAPRRGTTIHPQKA